MTPRAPNKSVYAAATTKGGDRSGRIPMSRKKGFQRMFEYTIAYA